MCLTLLHVQIFKCCHNCKMTHRFNHALLYLLYSYFMYIYLLLLYYSHLIIHFLRTEIPVLSYTTVHSGKQKTTFRVNTLPLSSGCTRFYHTYMLLNKNRYFKIQCCENFTSYFISTCQRVKLKFRIMKTFVLNIYMFLANAETQFSVRVTKCVQTGGYAHSYKQVCDGSCSWL